MTRRRGLLTLAVVTSIALLLTPLAWHQLRSHLRITLFELDGLHLDRRGLHLDRLTVHRDGPEVGRQHLTLADVTLADWGWSLRPNRVAIDTLSGRWDEPAQRQSHRPRPDLEELNAWLNRLPQRIQVRHFTVSLPCSSQRCRQEGRLDLQHGGSADSPARLKLELDHTGRTLGILATAHRSEDARLALDADVTIDGEQRISLQSTLVSQNGTPWWQGSLAMTELPEAEWLQGWLAQWLPDLPQPPGGAPSSLRLGAGWALALDGAEQASLDAVHGELAVSLAMPSAWPVPGVGLVGGSLELAARRQQGAPWQVRAASANLELAPDGELLAALPASLHPSQLALHVSPAGDEQTEAQLALDWRLAARGALSGELAGRLDLDPQTLRPLALNGVEGDLQATRLTLGSLAAQDIAASLSLDGVFDAEQNLALRLQPGTTLGARRVVWGQLDAGELSVVLGGNQLAVSARQWQLNGPLAVSVERLAHPFLKTLRWDWRGQTRLTAQTQRLEGRLENAAGLRIMTVIERNDVMPLRLKLKAPPIEFSRGNPLASTLEGWPALLAIDSGALQAQGTLLLSPSRVWTFEGQAQLEDSGGLHDRTAFQGLDARLEATLDRDSLAIDMLSLQVSSLDPGVPLGPLIARGLYQAPISAPGSGTLGWAQATLGLLGGTLWVEPGRLELGEASGSARVHLGDLSLARVFEAYPAEGLSGEGTLDGAFTLTLEPEGVSIAQGSLAAREPGGVLRLRSPGIRALAERNPAMRLVAEALDDFHYHHLSSTVRYAPNGDATLGLRLEGRNPALEGGRPINLNINLEENVPALLTSLQLSDRVSETVRQRVRERLEREPAAP